MTTTNSNRLATVVSYSSNERHFIAPLLRAAAQFSDLVVVSVGERLYSGEPEDEEGLSDLVEDFEGTPSVVFVRYPVPLERLKQPIALHNESRKRGVSEVVGRLGADCWVLLLDGDEVPDGPRVREWRDRNLNGATPPREAILRFQNHWLFLDPTLVADAIEDSVTLAHASVLTPEALDHPRERDGIVMTNVSQGRARSSGMVPGVDGHPMFWHFSWVRGTCLRTARAALKAKCGSWGHKDDRDWAGLIDRVFDDIEFGRWPARDFVHGYGLTRLPAPPAGVAPFV